MRETGCFAFTCHKRMQRSKSSEKTFKNKKKQKTEDVEDLVQAPIIQTSMKSADLTKGFDEKNQNQNQQTPKFKPMQPCTVSVLHPTPFGTTDEEDFVRKLSAPGTSSRFSSTDPETDGGAIPVQNPNSRAYVTRFVPIVESSSSEEILNENVLESTVSFSLFQRRSQRNVNRTRSDLTVTGVIKKLSKFKTRKVSEDITIESGSIISNSDTDKESSSDVTTPILPISKEEINSEEDMEKIAINLAINNQLEKGRKLDEEERQQNSSKTKVTRIKECNADSPLFYFERFDENAEDLVKAEDSIVLNKSSLAMVFETYEKHITSDDSSFPSDDLSFTENEMKEEREVMRRHEEKKQEEHRKRASGNKELDQKGSKGFAVQEE